jgi:hypothetical protein
MNSKREYEITYHLNGLATHKASIKLCKLEELIQEGSELVYAFNEVIDAVLDLNLGESMYFQPHRGDKTTKGIIVRVR